MAFLILVIISIEAKLKNVFAHQLQLRLQSLPSTLSMILVVSEPVVPSSVATPEKALPAIELASCAVVCIMSPTVVTSSTRGIGRALMKATKGMTERRIFLNSIFGGLIGERCLKCLM